MPLMVNLIICIMWKKKTRHVNFKKTFNIENIYLGKWNYLNMQLKWGVG